MTKTQHLKRTLRLFYKKHRISRRHVVQLFTGVLYNANLKGFITGRIYTGKGKLACVPGMNCYSCPGAIGACPLGSLQNALAASKTRTVYYILGTILLYAVLFGRTICGWLCPFGFLQDLLYKIKSFKIRKGNYSRILSYFKYLLLFGLVLVMPVAYGFKGLAVPGFCKYVCPVGTLEGAYGLVLNANNADLRSMLSVLFSWKSAILFVVLTLSVFLYRPFCRFLCPLGAIYSLFNRISFLSVQVDSEKCNQCGLCVRQCKMDVKKVSDRECIQCGECIPACPSHAIHYAGILRHLEDPVEAKKELPHDGV